MKNESLFILVLVSLSIITILSFSSCSTQYQACAAYSSIE